MKTFAGSLYNGSLLLGVAKLKQRNMENNITRLEYYNPIKKEIKTQKESVLPNAREFCKGRKMILIVFENNEFPPPKQYPSGNIMIGKKMKWIQHILFLKKLMNCYHQLSVEKRRLKKKKVLEKVVQSKNDTYNNLDELIYKAREYLDSDLIQKHFRYNTLEFI